MIEILLRVRGLKRRLIFNPTTAYSCREDGQAQVSLYHCDSSLQPFIRVHNETLSVVAMRVGNEDCSPVRIYGWHTAPTPTGFAEIVGLRTD